MRFGVYFGRIVKMAWLFSHRNNCNIFTRICLKGSGAYATRKNSENMVRFGVYFDQIVSRKVPKKFVYMTYFLYKK